MNWLPPALNQGEGAARLRAVPARARRSRLSKSGRVVSPASPASVSTVVLLVPLNEDER